jgi:propionyl-CoA synthetase
MVDTHPCPQLIVDMQGEAPETSSRYDAACEAASEQPDAFWAEAAKAVDWDKPFDRVFDPDQGAHGLWFTGGELNTAFNCLDRHVAAGRGEQPALIWDSPMAGRCETFTYRQLTDHVALMAGALAARGVTRGDRVIIYMPMVPQAVMAMLACARLGAVHSVVFGGFAGPELAKRIDDAKPRVIVTASCGLEPGRMIAYKPMVDDAIAASVHKPECCLVLQRPMLQAELVPGRDFDLDDELSRARPHDPVPVAATDPLYILYTSGTTGKPKGIVRDNGGHAVALRQSIGMIYGLQPGDVMFTASDVGWVVGHSYIVYAPLLSGLTTILFEGKPVGAPDPGAFWRVAAQHGAKAMFTAPTSLRAIRQQDSAGEHLRAHDLSRLEALFLAGERCDPPTAGWISDLLGKPIIDHWWQTETGWAITSNCRGLGLFPSKPGSGGRPTPGFDVRVLDDNGHDIGRETSGSLCVRLPMPPGCATGLWGDDGWFGRTYLTDYPGWYLTGDAGVIDADGDVFVMGRTDDIINVAGHRLSTGAIEEVLTSHPDVAECAVVGAADALKGQVPLGLVVLKAGAGRNEAEVAAELVALVRARIGPVAAFRDARVVARLPKTRSGKTLRATIRKIADGEPYAAPPTIDDPGVLDDLAAVLRRPR